MVNSYSTNGMFCSQENILMSLIKSPDRSERNLGVSIILGIRLRTPENSGIIRVICPDDYTVNPDASSLEDLNKRHITLAKTEPPATKLLSNEQLVKLVGSPMSLRLPLSSVAVERAVKDTTRVSLLAGSVEEQNGTAKLTVKSRNTAF